MKGNFYFRHLLFLRRRFLTKIQRTSAMKFYVSLISLLIIFQIEVKSQCLNHQLQDSVNSGRSARNLPGYSEGQSFTPTLSGTLCEVSMLMFAAAQQTGTGTLKLYAGNGTSGALLDSMPVNVGTPGTASVWQNWTLNNQTILTAGQTYTFQFIPIQGGGISDPYGVSLFAGDVYTGGNDISEPGWDLAFKISVDVTTSISKKTKQDRAILMPHPFSTQTILQTSENLKNADLSLYNSCGQLQREHLHISGNHIMIDRENLTAGLYFYTIIQDNALVLNGKMLITD
jgi:hypothetical protein